MRIRDVDNGWLMIGEDELEILWEDNAALVVNKPAGLLTQGAEGIDTLETRLRSLLTVRDSHLGKPYIGLPHRIDRPVSGAVLVAKNIRATQRFGAQFQSRKIGKTYWALVSGDLSPIQSTWTDFVRKVTDQPVAEIVGADAEGAKRAVLHYRQLRSLAAIEGCPLSLVEIELETGRMHQIRLQFGSRGFPLLGDSLYGSVSPFGPAVNDQRQRWIALHAREIRFRHPKTGIETCVEAPLPKASNQVLAGGPVNGWGLVDRV